LFDGLNDLNGLNYLNGVRVASVAVFEVKCLLQLRLCRAGME
jgi:hypothetical protein